MDKIKYIGGMFKEDWNENLTIGKSYQRLEEEFGENYNEIKNDKGEIIFLFPWRRHYFVEDNKK